MFGEGLHIRFQSFYLFLRFGNLCRERVDQNYLRTLLSLGFQAFLIVVCVAIYSVLVQNISVSGDIGAAIWTCMGYTVLLCFCLFKTSSLARSVFNAH